MNVRIDHTNHDHPNTKAARAACRKSIKAEGLGAVKWKELKINIWNVQPKGSNVIHRTMKDGTQLLCTGKAVKEDAAPRSNDVTCKNCLKKL